MNARKSSLLHCLLTPLENAIFADTTSKRLESDNTAIFAIELNNPTNLPGLTTFEIEVATG